MTRECIAIRHVCFENLGLLADLLAERDIRSRYLDAGVQAVDAKALAEADLVVVLGGPIGVYEQARYPFLAQEIAAVRARIDSGRAILGICLGAQIIASALGAQVKPGPGKEIGWGAIELTPDGERSVLAPLKDIPVLHWHGDNLALPSGAANLARTAACPHQAFAMGAKVLALQFHIEANPACFEQWLIGHTVELGQAGIDPRTLRQQAQEHGKRTAEVGRRVLSAWLDRALS